jgi:hypothetical protein
MACPYAYSKPCIANLRSGAPPACGMAWLAGYEERLPSGPETAGRYESALMVSHNTTWSSSLRAALSVWLRCVVAGFDTTVGN